MLTPVDVVLSGYRLVLVNPGIHVTTKWAFSQLTPGPNESASFKSFQTIIAQPVGDWKNSLVNDFEKPVFKKYPEILHIKEALYKKGALYASMSGSGSTVFGIFDKERERSFTFPPHYFLHTSVL